jgi:hypothetical protein
MVIRRMEFPGATNIFMLAPKYQFAATSSYQLFSGLDVAIAYVLRQGYATPFHASHLAASVDARGVFRNVLLVADPGRARLSPAHTLDARLSKSFATRGVHVYELHLDLDVFNVLNRAIVLSRGYDLSRPDFNRILGVVNPRSVRIGVRVNF